jgi:EAL domain-containing protein (putative c-di-GMP-specific phosphodiesterase class I)
MPAVTRAVLSMAVRDCARLRADGHDLTVSVNLSASDLHDGTLPELVRNTLIDHGLPAAALVLEITETNVMVDPVRSERTLLRLHELGVDLSVDDYGTGHCSLSYLRRLPVQELKLDQSFVRDLATEPRDMAIMQSSVGLAHSLDMRLVAEGVEDADALRLLVAAGCDLTQGWYLARPMPYGSLVDWLQVRQRHELARLRPA